MHYFTPPVQAAVSLVRKQAVCGKLEALRLAAEVFPNTGVIDMVLDTVDRHYETPELYRDATLTEIEVSLEQYLRDAYVALAGHAVLIDVDPSDTPQRVRAKVAEIPIDPTQQFYEGAKFCRFMKGRLLFYATNIPWFDTTFLIRNELRRIVNNFYQTPLNAFARARFNENLPAEAVLDRLRGNLLSPELCNGAVTFARIAGEAVPNGREKQRAREVAEVFDPIQITLEILGAELKKVLSGR